MSFEFWVASFELRQGRSGLRLRWQGWGGVEESGRAFARYPTLSDDRTVGRGWGTRLWCLLLSRELGGVGGGEFGHFFLLDVGVEQHADADAERDEADGGSAEDRAYLKDG